MKKAPLVFCILILCTGCRRKDTDTTIKEEPTEFITYGNYTLQELQNDFNQFRRLITTQHPQYFTDEEKLQELFDRQQALLRDGMDVFEFYKVLLPVIGELGDSHTLLSIPDVVYEATADIPCYLPLIVGVHGDNLNVAVSLFEEEIPSGSEILSINGDQIDEILTIIKKQLPSDGRRPEAQEYLMNLYFNEFYCHQIGSPLEFKIEFLTPDGAALMIKKVPGVLLEDIRHQRNLSKEKYDILNTDPLTIEINNDYAYLRLKGSMSENDESFVVDFFKYRKTLDDFFITLDSEHMHNLILDLRTGYGSSPLMAAYLFSCLIDRPEPYFSEGTSHQFSQLEVPQEVHDYHYKGRLFVLIDGSTLSVWGQLAALLKYHDRAVFIGEESGSSALTGLDVRHFVLTKTLLGFQYPVNMWSVAVENMPFDQGIKPDYPAVQTMNDFLNNVDSIKERAIDVIHE